MENVKLNWYCTKAVVLKVPGRRIRARFPRNDSVHQKWEGLIHILFAVSYSCGRHGTIKKPTIINKNKKAARMNEAWR